MGILNKMELVEDIRKEIRQHIDENNGETDLTIIWDALKAVVRGKLKPHLKKKKKKVKLETYKNCSERLRELEQQYQTTSDQEVYTNKQIKNTKTTINDILVGEMEKRHLFLKQSYYEMGPRSTKLIAKTYKKTGN